MGTQHPLPNKGVEPQFSAHVYSGQTAAWIRIALGMEVDLGPGHIVLDGDPVPSPQNGVKPPPIFSPFLLWPNGWMHQDATWYGGRPPGDIVRWGPSLSTKKGTAPLPNIQPMCFVAKWLYVSGYHLVQR